MNPALGKSPLLRFNYGSKIVAHGCDPRIEENNVAFDVPLRPLAHALDVVVFPFT